MGSLLVNSKKPLELFGRQVKEMTEKFQKLNKEWSKYDIAVSTKQSELKKTIDDLNGLYQVGNAKYKSLHDKFEANNASQERLSPANSMSSTSSVSPSPSPIPGNSPALIPNPPLSLKRSDSRSSFTRPAAGPVKDAWPTSSLRSLSPPPRLQQSIESPSPDRQSTALVGPRQHLIFIPRNQKGTPSEAYLVEIPTDDGGLSSPRSIGGDGAGAGAGGGMKRKHLQRGGAPLPEVLPSNSEIRIVDAYNPGMADLITGLTPPNKLLHDTSEENPDHPTIAKIRTGIPIVDQPEKERIYGQIRQFLITKESKNPLDIGRKAVYKVNILKLLTLLDKQLGNGHQYRLMYDRLWTFMDYDFGTFNVLNFLFNSTFNPPKDMPNSPRLSSTPTPRIITAVLKEQQIKKVVGWEPKYKNKLFDNLFDIFSMICKSTQKESTFLSDDNPLSQKNLGSKQKYYYRFRLNWIILLAFHSLNIGRSTPEIVSSFISSLYEVFLGWMSHNKDTFARMFFQDNPNVDKSTDIYSEKVDKLVKQNIISQPLFADTVKTIKEKICELQENTAKVIDIDQDVEEDDDTDYVPSSDDESDSDTDTDSVSDDGRTSSRDTSSRGSLSSAGLSHKDVVTGGPTTRNVRQPLRPGLSASNPPPVPRLNLPRPNVLLNLGKKESVSPEFIDAARSNVGIIQLPVPVPKEDDGVLFRAEDRNPPVTKSFLDSSRAAADAAAAAAPITSRTFQHSSRSTAPANQELWATKVLPRPPNQNGEFIRQTKSNRPNSASSSGKTSTNSQESVQGSVPGSASGWLTGRRGNRVHQDSSVPTLITGAVNPEWQQSNRDTVNAGGTLPLAHKTFKQNRVVPVPYNKHGGSHKKRTRKHKKQISRHPTRRRRIAKPIPPEGHKYTRKRSRT